MTVFLIVAAVVELLPILISALSTTKLELQFKLHFRRIFTISTKISVTQK